MGSGLSKNARHGIAVEVCHFFRSSTIAMEPHLDTAEPARRLVELIAGFGSCAVAFSGGVDSTVVAKAAQLALGDRAVAVTGSSASLAEGELEAAGQLAALIGIRHVVIDTDEFANPDYAATSPTAATTARPSCTRSSKRWPQRTGRRP